MAAGGSTGCRSGDEKSRTGSCSSWLRTHHNDKSQLLSQIQKTVGIVDVGFGTAKAVGRCEKRKKFQVEVISRQLRFRLFG
jgi:hypothetical protein